jgi:hypothetical protein
LYEIRQATVRNDTLVIFMAGFHYRSNLRRSRWPHNGFRMTRLMRFPHRYALTRGAARQDVSLANNFRHG